MSEIKTHTRIDQSLCGQPLEVGEGRSRVSLTTLAVMTVDGHGLVHGGYLFGLADYAAMIAVNDPNVVLGGAEVKFLKPVQVGETIVAEAKVLERAGKKNKVSVTVYREEEAVFSGEFVCFVLDKHVLT